MIEDLQHVTVLNAMAEEILRVCVRYNEQANGVTDKATLLDIRTRQNDELADLLGWHRRALDHMAGKPVEPIAHEATAVLVGVVGGTAT